MAVGSDKTRTQLTIEKTLKAEIEMLAKNDERSFNSMVVKILKDFVKSKEANK